LLGRPKNFSPPFFPLRVPSSYSELAQAHSFSLSPLKFVLPFFSSKKLLDHFPLAFFPTHNEGLIGGTGVEPLFSLIATLALELPILPSTPPLLEAVGVFFHLKILFIFPVRPVSSPVPFSASFVGRWTSRPLSPRALSLYPRKAVQSFWRTTCLLWS